MTKKFDDTTMEAIKVIRNYADVGLKEAYEILVAAMSDRTMLEYIADNYK